MTTFTMAVTCTGIERSVFCVRAESDVWVLSQITFNVVARHRPNVGSRHWPNVNFWQWFGVNSRQWAYVDNTPEERHRNHYNNTGSHYNNTGSHYNNTGSHYNNTGSHYNNTGSHYNNTAKHYNRRQLDVDCIHFFLLLLFRPVVVTAVLYVQRQVEAG